MDIKRYNRGPIKGKRSSINEWLGGIDKYHLCQDCKTLRPAAELNFEGLHHHSASVICIDRKQCERSKRKKN